MAQGRPLMLKSADNRPPRPAEVDRLLGRAVREASSNLLRHSEAFNCRIPPHRGAPPRRVDEAIVTAPHKVKRLMSGVNGTPPAGTVIPPR
jgi:hypothetical protein